MTGTLVNPVELDQSARHRGGILASALPLPEGWTRGIAVNLYGCGEPIVRDKCVTAVDEPHRPGVAEYAPFPIEQGSTCSTLTDIDHEARARDRLDATTEWALGQQLALDVVGTGNPSFADAILLGTTATETPYSSVVAAVACLEQAAADAGFGARWVLHSSVRGAAYLAYHGRGLAEFDPSGQLRSPAGAPVIISPGYPSEGASENTVRYWVTGSVWAGVSAVDVHSGTPDFRRNSLDGWAMRVGLVAFDPCINFAIDAVVPTCPTPA